MLILERVIKNNQCCIAHLNAAMSSKVRDGFMFIAINLFFNTL